MSELLLKEQVLKELSVIQARPVSTAMKIIRELPTIDIIRCSDCKNKRIYRFPPSYDEKPYCETHEKVTKLDNYCSWAERRTDE